jgi:hypothetical protein
VGGGGGFGGEVWCEVSRGEIVGVANDGRAVVTVM